MSQRHRTADVPSPIKQELRAQAFTDPLTPLANRTYFIQHVTAALESSRRREGRPRGSPGDRAAHSGSSPGTRG